MAGIQVVARLCVNEPDSPADRDVSLIRTVLANVCGNMNVIAVETMHPIKNTETKTGFNG